MQSPWAANKTQPIPRTPAENTALTIGGGKHPTGSARRDTVHRTPRSSPQNTLPQRSHARGPHANTATAQPHPRAARKHCHSTATPGKARETGKIRASKGPGS